MIIDRTREIAHRARHRLVLAMISVEAHEPDLNAINTKNMGINVQDGKASVKANERGFLVQSACVFETDAECDPAIERSPTLMDNVRKKLSDRMQAYVAQGLHQEDLRPLFESEDVILEATGLPAKISITLPSKDDQVLARVKQDCPFEKLRGHLTAIHEKMMANGGRLVSVDMTHKSGISAFDFYEIAGGQQSTGWKPSYGEIMLRSADRLLGDIGIPRVLN